MIQEIYTDDSMSNGWEGGNNCRQEDKGCEVIQVRDDKDGN